MLLIAGTWPHLYLARMAAMLFRLITLIALVLMPVGMSGTALAAQPTVPAAAASHCGGEEHPEQAPLEQMDAQCMACAGLPASQADAAPERLLPAAPRLIALIPGFAGTEPEIATPPPKRG